VCQSSSESRLHRPSSPATAVTVSRFRNQDSEWGYCHAQALTFSWPRQTGLHAYICWPFIGSVVSQSHLSFWANFRIFSNYKTNQLTLATSAGTENGNGKTTGSFSMQATLSTNFIHLHTVRPMRKVGPQLSVVQFVAIERQKRDTEHRQMHGSPCKQVPSLHWQKQICWRNWILKLSLTLPK